MYMSLWMHFSATMATLVQASPVYSSRFVILDTFGAETRVDQVSRHRNKNSLKLNYTSYMGFLYGVVYSLQILHFFGVAVSKALFKLELWEPFTLVKIIVWF